MSLSDGDLRWSERLTDNGAFGFSLGPTDVGVMVPYSDETGDHLVLLDEDDGSVAWETEASLYDNFGQWAPGVGIVMPGEYSYAAVDLADGTMARLADDEYWGFLDDEFVRLDGDTVVLGVDPFGDTEPSGTLELPVVPDDLIDAGDVVVITSGEEVVGFADGAEQWRVTAPFVPNLVAQASDHHLVLVSEGNVQVIRFDAASAELLAQPAGLLDPQGDAEVDGRVFLVGVAGSGTGLVEDTRQTKVLELGDDAVTEVGSFPFTAYDDPWVVGPYVVAFDDGTVVARTLVDLAEAGPTPPITVTDDEELDFETTGDGAMLVLDSAAGVLHLYQ
jgi:outer membrane protein assembly factor BamB